MIKMRELCILALAETRLNGKRDRTIHENHRLLYIGKGIRNRVDFLVSNIMAVFVEMLNCVNEEIIGMYLKLEKWC